MSSWRDYFDAAFLARLQRLRIAAKRAAARAPAGRRPSGGLGDGLEFADHRPYVWGDDLRFIDWPYYARMERLLLRLFHQHSEAEVTILLDASGSMAAGAGKFAYARRAAAALAYVALGGLERVAVASFAEGLGKVVSVGRRRERFLRVLDALSALVPAGPTDLLRAAEAWRRTRGGAAGQTVLVVSDLLGCEAHLPAALDRLGSGAGVLHVYSPRDAGVLEAGPVLLEDAETGDRLAADAHPAVAEAYRRRWASYRQGCERTCAARGAAYVAAPTDAPFEQLVLRALRRAGVVAG